MSRPVQKASYLFVAVFVAGLPAARAEEKPDPIRVLLLSGKNNHDWKKTTPALKSAYEASGRFAVDVTEKPEAMTAEQLADYGAVVSNWTNWPDVDKRAWGPQAEKALVDFVRGGKGFVVIHAASTPFQTWPEYQRMVGSTWKLKQTGHGRAHSFKVQIADPKHPITRGMDTFWTTDELWHRTAKQPNIHVLCEAFSSGLSGGSRATEVVAHCQPFGKGRCVNIVLGHDVRAIENVGFQALLLRGTEWAATGKVTIPAPASGPGTTMMEIGVALAEITSHTFGQSRAPLQAVEQWVQKSGTDPALREAACQTLVGMIGPNAKGTAECKQFVCSMLGLIGRKQEVPALATLLLDEDLSLAARSALERIRGPEAAAALRGAVPKSQGRIRIGLVNSLGNLQDRESVDAIAGLLTGKDRRLAAAAVDALRKIGGSSAAKALAAARSKLPERLRFTCDAALLSSADALRSSGKTAEAKKLYEDLAAPDRPRHIRQAAIVATFECADGDPSDDLLNALKGTDPVRREAAVAFLRKGDRTGDRLTGLVRKALASVNDADTKQALLRLLGSAVTVEAMQLARSMVDDEGAARAACDTVLSIGEKLVGQKRGEVTSALTAVLAKPRPEAIRQRALALLLHACGANNLALGAKASSPDDLEKDGASHGDQAAIDGNAETYWDEKDNQKLYRLRVTFPKPTEVSVISILGYRHRDYAPRAFEVLCDGKAVVVVPNARYEDNRYILPLPRTRCTVLELKITGYYGKSPAIRELGIYDVKLPEGAQ